MDTYPQGYPLIHRFFHISTGGLSTGLSTGYPQPTYPQVYPHDDRHTEILFRQVVVSCLSR